MSNDIETASVVNNYESQLRAARKEHLALKDRLDLAEARYRHLEAISGNQLTTLTQHFTESQRLRQVEKDLKKENIELKDKLAGVTV